MQYGRNDISAYINRANPGQYLPQVQQSLSRLWQRLKLQGLWVGQATVQPYVRGVSPFTDPYAQTPTAVEEPLRQPLNAWIRTLPNATNRLVDHVFEVSDALEYFDNGVRTNRWNYLTGNDGARIALTYDGLHTSEAAWTQLFPLFQASVFAPVTVDPVPPCLASAIVPEDGSRVVLAFNELRNPPLLGLEGNPDFLVLVNGEERLLRQVQQTGSKEATLWLSGLPIKEGATVEVRYQPGFRTPVSDSAPGRNPLAAFTAAAWNNSVMVGTESRPQIQVSGVELSRNSGRVAIQVELSNRGGSMASEVVLDSAMLNQSPTLTVTPRNVGAVGAGASQVVTLEWLAPASGSRAILHVGGTYPDGRFISSVRVTIP